MYESEEEDAFATDRPEFVRLLEGRVTGEYTPYFLEEVEVLDRDENFRSELKALLLPMWPEGVELTTLGKWRVFSAVPCDVFERHVDWVFNL